MTRPYCRTHQIHWKLLVWKGLQPSALHLPQQKYCAWRQANKWLLFQLECHQALSICKGERHKKDESRNKFAVHHMCIALVRHVAGKDVLAGDSMSQCHIATTLFHYIKYWNSPRRYYGLYCPYLTVCLTDAEIVVDQPPYRKSFNFTRGDRNSSTEWSSERMYSNLRLLHTVFTAHWRAL